MKTFCVHSTRRCSIASSGRQPTVPKYALATITGSRNMPNTSPILLWPSLLSVARSQATIYRLRQLRKIATRSRDLVLQ